MGYSSRPSEWSAKYDEYRQFVLDTFEYEGCAKPSEEAVQERLGNELKLALISTISEATEANIEINTKRFASLHWASRLAALAFLPLIICTGTYAFMTWRAPGRPAPVTVVDPVAVKVDTAGAEVCVSEKKPPVRPQPPRPEFIKEGDVPKPRPPAPERRPAQAPKPKEGTAAP